MVKENKILSTIPMAHLPTQATLEVTETFRHPDSPKERITTPSLKQESQTFKKVYQKAGHNKSYLSLKGTPGYF